MTAQELVHPAHADLVDGHVRLAIGERAADLHPIWLRNRSQEPGQVEATNRQRLFTPLDVPGDLCAVGSDVSDGVLVVSFSDGHTARLDLDELAIALGWLDDVERPPAPEPWTAPVDPFPYVDWNAIGWSGEDADPAAVLDFLTAFYRHGYVVFRNTPVEDGTVRRVCDRLGYISGNNFGWTFDVRAEPKPTDLAYTAIKLLAHTDQPYRQPVPGIQLLHCLRNGAPGGDSTLADGLAGAEALAAADPAGVVDFLTAFYRYGYVVFQNAPAADGTVRRICDRLGYISGNNFGWTFDVRAEPRPTDLAYTAIKLLAHTDQPYRQPVPGIQLLHCLRNEAPGGDSTLADGLAGAEALAAIDPAAHQALTESETEFRYDMITDTVITFGRVLEYDRSGRFRQIRLNTKLDAPLPRPEYDLDGYYRGRRWLTEWLNDPSHQVTFRLEPGDAMFVDNYRVLHGRTEFDASKGMRHLQGAYIDHDGPDTMYRLAVRQLAGASAA